MSQPAPAGYSSIMTSRTPLDALFAGYLRDLVQIAELARVQRERENRAANSLVGKLALEAVRLSAYERAFLLPVAAEVLDDGPAVVDREVARLDRLEELVGGLEALDMATGGPALDAVADYAAELASDQRHGLLPRLAQALPAGDLVELGARVTPTQEPGSTHSHPKLTGGHDVTTWPGVGMLHSLREAFATEISLRQAV
ncbi:hypothetical protein EV189_3130 [Motilibacter rhizosphaerae]|uniref:Uncharacterized protein n=1 Tax=Motilibacter rhizosphaerae TaxID=598652 RepID=A0A4Q7NFZ6_9ACTN|nr:hypothetical protein [Motilibacter rhizosphaerae]RZS82735.1 hypothetical protein EV189_3130 [Motilibacter rhizosphaerae]